MGHTSIKKYRRKTRKNKSEGKKLHLKQNLKLRTKQKNAKKTQKRFRLKNKPLKSKTKRMKNKTKKMKKKTKTMKGGDEDETKLLTFPDRKDAIYKKADGKFDGAAYMKAIQAYNKQQADAMHVKDPIVDRTGQTYMHNELCSNVDPSNNNEIGSMNSNYLKFQFKEGRNNNIYCYNYEDIVKDLNNIGNICCVWKKTNPGAADNEEGYGTSCIVRNTYDLLDNVCNYINMVDASLNNPESFTAGDDYLCVWKSLINARTWISQDAVKTILENKCNSDKGTFILTQKQPNERTLIGNLYNVFGVGMLHGQQPGEFIFDIEFQLDNENEKSCTFTTDIILDNTKLLGEFDNIYNQFWNAPLSDEEMLNVNDSGVSDTVFNMQTPPRNPITPVEQMSPISPNRQLFSNSPGGSPFRSIRDEIESNAAYSPYVISNDRPLTIEDLSWGGLDSVFSDMDTTRSHYLPIVSIPIVSIPTNATNDTPSVTDGFVYLSPTASLRPTSDRRGNTFDNNSTSPMDRTPPGRGTSSQRSDRTRTPHMLFPPTPGVLTSSAQSPSAQSPSAPGNRSLFNSDDEPSVFGFDPPSNNDR